MYEEAGDTLVKIIVLVHKLVVVWRVIMKKVESLICVCKEGTLTLEEIYGEKQGLN